MDSQPIAAYDTLLLVMSIPSFTCFSASLTASTYASLPSESQYAFEIISTFFSTFTIGAPMLHLLYDSMPHRAKAIRPH